jgi:hypothetical protein
MHLAFRSPPPAPNATHNAISQTAPGSRPYKIRPPRPALRIILIHSEASDECKVQSDE